MIESVMAIAGPSIVIQNTGHGQTIFMASDKTPWNLTTGIKLRDHRKHQSKQLHCRDF